MGKDNIKSSNLQIQNSYLELRQDTPLVEICDNKRVLIENHRGIVCYGVNEIIVRVKKGCISVLGSHLCLARMNKTKLVICGDIHSVCVQKGMQ